MGEQKVELLEQTVQHNSEDVRQLKKKMERVENDLHDVKTEQRLAQQSMTHILGTLDELKGSFKELDKKMDEDKEQQLKAYKTASWKVAIAIIVSFLLINLGLK